MTSTTLQLPLRFENKLKEVPENHAAITDIIARFGQIYEENNLYFFEEYTDHGWRHISSVLKASDELITEESFPILTSNDILLLVAAIFLHDLGMHIQPSAFRKMVTDNGKGIVCPDFDEKPWPILWEEYLKEARRFSSKKRLELFGDENIDILIPDLKNTDKLTGIDKKLIGEFIRRHHPRLAHEIALHGIESHKSTLSFFNNAVDDGVKDLAGLIARSHGMEIRNTMNYLKKKYTGGWKRPYNSSVFYLMVIIRIADYFQIDATRVLKIPFLTKEFKSPLSFSEHHKHLQTKYTQKSDDDPESLFVYATPTTSIYYLALDSLFKSIQNELDRSWAVLGEIYGNMNSENKLKIVYRRISSNIFEKNEFAKTVYYIPEVINFSIDKEIPKLLIAPLYGDNPTYGVRELLQNSVDACLERQKLEGVEYTPLIKIKICKNKSNISFSIEDNGKGMTLNEIRKYFLSIGSSFRKSMDWENRFLDEKGKSKIRRSGRFGIGILAAYLLGDTIEVETRSYSNKLGYRFVTNLQNEQIDIYKLTDIEVGTTIKVNISKSVLKKLFSEGQINSDYIDFFNWYKLKHPFIEYSITDQNKTLNMFPDKLYDLSDDEKWNKVMHIDFSDIRWKYNEGTSRSSKQPEFVLCNGIIIQNGFRIKDEIIERTPIISVFDNDAKLPISLNRNFIANRLPFEKELVKDIYEKFIYDLMLFKVDADYVNNEIVINRNIWFTHPASVFRFPIIYSPSGFILRANAFLGKFNGYNLVNCRFSESDRTYGLTKIKEHQLKVELMPKHLLYIGENFIIDYPIQLFDKIESGIIREEFKSDLKKELDNDLFHNWINHKNKYFLHKSLPNKYIEIFEKSGLRSLLIYALSVKQHAEGHLSNLIDEYLGPDPTIPYDLAKRKKKFPKIFKELNRFSGK